MTSIDSNPFAILLIGDFTGFYSGAGDFSGTLFGGGAADLSVPIGTGDWLSLETFRLSSFCPTTPCGYYDVQLDDVTVRAVPIPAAFWLFASALGALGWRRRNRY